MTGLQNTPPGGTSAFRCVVTTNVTAVTFQTKVVRAEVW
jgi:hypothetical protein